MITLLKKLTIFIFFVLLLSSCTHTFYHVSQVDSKSNCDTPNATYKIRIVNTGKIGISSVSVNTDNGYVTFQGVEPGDTTCYFSIPAFYTNAEYKIYTLRVSWFGRSNGIRFGVQPHFHDENKKSKPGFYTLIVELSRNHMIPGVNKKKRKIYPARVAILRD